MLGSRKLTRLLEHAQHAQAKVVLVGDDRQLAAIDAGGGFRALRLGASELMENRRQHQAWEREAPELVRSGLVDEAVAAYQAHNRVVAADSKPAATLALLQDWWAAFQQADHDPTQEVIVLAARRTEVIGSTAPARSSWPSAAASAPSGSRSRTANSQSGTGSSAATTPSASWGGQRHSWHHRRPRLPRPDPEPSPGRHQRPNSDASQVLSGRPRKEGAEPAGWTWPMPPPATGPRIDPRPGPGAAHRQRGRQLAACAAVPGPPGHPPGCRGRPRSPGGRGAGSARPRAGIAPAPATPRRLAGGERPSWPAVSAGRAGSSLAVHDAKVPWARWSPTGCRSWRPGGCQACCVSSRRCWGPSGWPAWPTRPGPASTPPLDPGAQALSLCRRPGDRRRR
jgi:AAA domain